MYSLEKVLAEGGTGLEGTEGMGEEQPAALTGRRVAPVDPGLRTQLGEQLIS